MNRNGHTVEEEVKKKTFKSPLRESMNGIHHVNQNYCSKRTAYCLREFFWNKIHFFLFNHMPYHYFFFLKITKKKCQTFCLFYFASIPHNWWTDDVLLSSSKIMMFTERNTIFFYYSSFFRSTATTYHSELRVIATFRRWSGCLQRIRHKENFVVL